LSETGNPNQFSRVSFRAIFSEAQCFQNVDPCARTNNDITNNCTANNLPVQSRSCCNRFLRRQAASGCTPPGFENACRSSGITLSLVRGALRISGVDIATLSQDHVKGALAAAIAGVLDDALDEPVEPNDCTIISVTPGSKKQLQTVVSFAIAVSSGSSGAATAALANPDVVQSAVFQQFSSDVSTQTVANSITGVSSADVQATDVSTSANPDQFEICFAAFGSADCHDGSGSAIGRAIDSLLGNGNTFCVSTNGQTCDAVEANPANILATACAANPSPFRGNAVFSLVCANQGLIANCQSNACCPVLDTASFTTTCRVAQGNPASAPSGFLAICLSLVLAVLLSYRT